jgi:hypothetical protein
MGALVGYKLVNIEIWGFCTVYGNFEQKII